MGSAADLPMRHDLRHWVMTMAQLGFAAALCLYIVHQEAAEPVAVIFALLPFLLGAFWQRLKAVSLSEWLFWGCLLQMPLLVWALAEFRPAPEGTATDPSKWSGLAMFIAVAFLRGLYPEETLAVLKRALPVFLIGVFVVLCVYKIGFPETNHRLCRVKGATLSPFLPALFFSVLVFLYAAIADYGDRWGRAMVLLLLSLGLIVAWGLAGARMISVIYIFYVLGMAASFAHQGQTRLYALGLAATIPVGIGVSLGLDLLTGCQNVMRLFWFLAGTDGFSSLTYVQNTSTSAGFDQMRGAEVAVHGRLKLLAAGWQEARANWLWGTGIWYDQVLSSENGHRQLHNQFLSWMIWGGIGMLASGLIFLAAPFALLKEKMNTQSLMAVLAVSLPLTLSLLTDSLLRLPDFLLAHILCVTLAYMMVSEMKRRQTW